MSTHEERINPYAVEYCGRCNYDRHTCPGCGDNLPHGVEVCTDCIAELKKTELICPICQKGFQPYKAMRNDARGVPWCEECTEEHDNIDWDEVAEKRMGM